MTTTDARLRLAQAIERMAAASVSLEAKLTDEGLRQFIDSSHEASKAHAELMVAAMSRARKGRTR